MKAISSAAVKRKGLGGVVAVVGFLLSPLSWWNDLVVNVPLALMFAWLVGLFYRHAFAASFVVGYWLTNIVGLILMHWGAATALSKAPRPYDGRQLGRDLIIALLYTALIVLLMKLNVLGPLPASIRPR